MKQKTRIVLISTFSIGMMLVLACPVRAQVGNPQETLKQYIAELQKDPNDNALREKIIKLALEMKPAPAIPEEARRHYVMALTLFEDANNIKDFNDSIEEFNKALLAAPWWPEANLKLAVALKAAQRYDEAIGALNLYISTNPGEKEARSAQDEIYILEAKQKKAAKESAATAKKNTEEEHRKETERSKEGELAGTLRDRVWRENRVPDRAYHLYLKVDGDELVEFSIWDNPWNGGPKKGSIFNDCIWRWPLRSRNFIVTQGEAHVLISEDGNMIFVEEEDTQPPHHVVRKPFVRQR
ncbi:MAG: hypothetical protein JW749_03315 [Sedimentisphaerales bacterium]|nr:hypothetical protein [Sedimentisphaerales bacterium]